MSADNATQFIYIQKLGNSIDDVLDAHQRKKFCLIFGNQVFKTFDTKQEMDDEAARHPNLNFTLYHPKSLACLPAFPL